MADELISSKKVDTVYDLNAAEPKTLAAAKDFHKWLPGVSVIDRRAAELTTKAGYDNAKVQQLRTTFAEIGKVLPGSDAAVMQIAEGHIDNILAGTRVVTDAEAEADEVALLRQIKSNNEQLLEELRKRHGAREGEQLFERARRFVLSHPKLAAVLRERGLGSRPEIFEGIVAHVFSNGIR